MNGQDLLNEIGLKAYKKPLSEIRNLSVWPSLSNPVHLAVLLIDFDSEVTINGLLGFLENPTGAFLNETIDAFQMLEANETTHVLRRIQDVMNKHAVSHERLRGTANQANEYQITSFSELHNSSLDDFAEEVGDIEQTLYMHDKSQSSPFRLLEAYLEQHATEVLSQINDATP